MESSLQRAEALAGAQRRARGCRVDRRGLACARTSGRRRSSARRVPPWGCSTAKTSWSSTRSGSPRRLMSRAAGSRSTRRRCCRWRFGRVEPFAPTTGRPSRPTSPRAPRYSLHSLALQWPCRSGRQASRSAPSSSSSTARMPSTTSWLRSPRRRRGWQSRHSSEPDCTSVSGRRTGRSSESFRSLHGSMPRPRQQVTEAVCREARVTFGADYGVLWRIRGDDLELVEQRSAS